MNTGLLILTRALLDIFPRVGLFCGGLMITPISSHTITSFNCKLLLRF